MVFSVINEGFANQLYRYCSAYATARRVNTELILVIQTSNAISDPFQLSDLNVVCDDIITTNSQIETCMLLNQLKQRYNLITITEENYDDVILGGEISGYDGILMTNHFQSVHFFEEYLSEINSMLKFDISSAFLLSFEQEISKKNAIGVHVRRGDYKYYKGCVASIDYYKAAMCLMDQTFEDEKPEYYFFSDDIEYVKSEIGNDKRFHYVHNPGGFRESVEEFIALSMCDHYILTSVSSFGRLAESLHKGEGRIAIFDAFGYETMVNHTDYTFFLYPEQVAELSTRFDSIFENNEKKYEIDENKEIHLRISKINEEMERGCYNIALGQLKKLWEMLFETGIEEEKKMHELYFECLKNLGFWGESIIEASFLQDSKYINFLLKEQVDCVNLLREKRCRFVIVPQRIFNPMWYEEMVNFGITLRRMGYDVLFLFWEPVPGMEKYFVFNKKLHSCEHFVKSRGTDTHCKQKSINDVIIENGSLSSYFRSFSDKKTVFVYKQREILEAIVEAELQNDVRVYWDESNLLDAGNFYESGDRIINSYNASEDVSWLKNNSDYYVSYSDIRDENIIRINLAEEYERCCMSDFDMTSTDYFEKALSVIKKIPSDKVFHKISYVQKQPQVDILIPTYDMFHIEMTVKSVLAQTYSNIMVTICDMNGVLQREKEFLNKYRNNPHIVIKQFKEGVNTVQTCLNEVVGEYTVILESGNYLSPLFISETFYAMDKETDAAFIYVKNAIFKRNCENYGSVDLSLGDCTGRVNLNKFFNIDENTETRHILNCNGILFRTRDIVELFGTNTHRKSISNMNEVDIDYIVKKYEHFYYIAKPLVCFAVE